MLSRVTAKNVGDVFLRHTVEMANMQLNKSVQNAITRVTTETRKFDHIMPVLCERHWLPVRKHIVYKLVVMVYKCMHGLAASDRLTTASCSGR